MVFIGLASPELAIARVAQRTESGGHDVPDEKIMARFPRTLDNLRKALALVDHTFLFDNSSAEQPYRFVAEFKVGELVKRGRYRPVWSMEFFKRRQP